MKLDSQASQRWLVDTMHEAGIETLADLELQTGINKGTLSRYFRHLQRPSIDVIPGLCQALKVSPATLLWGLGVMDRDDQVRPIG